MASEVRWTVQSIDDLGSIADFIARDSPYLAQVQIEKFFKRVLILEAHPRVGRVVPELNEVHVRELIEGSYRIIHRILPNMRVDILSVHHSRRMLPDFQ